MKIKRKYILTTDWVHRIGAVSQYTYKVKAIDEHNYIKL